MHMSYLENICEVFTMNLEHEAIYIPKSLGRFKLPQDRLDLAALLLAVGPLVTVKVSAHSIIQQIHSLPLMFLLHQSSCSLFNLRFY